MSKDCFDNARRNANPDCQKCYGTGQFMYDHNHSTICPLCCKHNMGWWELGEGHSNPGHWCCLAGCGLTFKECPDTSGRMIYAWKSPETL